MITGVKAGLIAGIVVGLISNLLSLMNMSGICIVILGERLFRQAMSPGALPLAWLAIAWVNHLILSGLLGVVLSYFLWFSGTDYALIKGLMFGAAVFYVDIAFLSPLAGYVPQRLNPVDLFIVLGYHLLFGVLTAWLVVKLGGKVVRRH